MDTIRLSLDLTYGTFTQVETVCKEEFRNKADYLRMLIEADLAKREEGRFRRGAMKKK